MILFSEGDFGGKLPITSQHDTPPLRIKFIGIGGAGGKAVCRMMDSPIDGA